MKKSGFPLKRALFVLPADMIGGAERLTATFAETASKENMFEQIDIFVLAKSPTGSLDYLNDLPDITITHTHARREPSGILPFIRFLNGKRFDFTFTTHTHVNALCCALRRFGILKTHRYVTRESIAIFEYDAGRFNRIIPLLVQMYGNQDYLIHQTSQMEASFNLHTNNRLQRKCRTLNNPVDVNRIASQALKPLENRLELQKDDRTNVVWCGYLTPRKRPLLAIEALQSLHKGGRSNTHLIFIGDGPLMAAALEKASRTGLDDHITFAGHQENPWAIMARCDIGLLTSEMEGFPNVTLEMLASGVCGVVTTNCAGDLDAVPGVKVCPNADPDALAALVSQTIDGERSAEIPSFLGSRTPAAYLQQLVSMT